MNTFVLSCLVLCAYGLRRGEKILQNFYEYELIVARIFGHCWHKTREYFAFSRRSCIKVEFNDQRTKREFNHRGR